MSFYHKAGFFLRYPLRLLYRIKVINPQNVPNAPFILYANHTSYSDPLVVAAALKSDLRFVARSNLLRFRFYRWLFNKIRVIAINRKTADIAAIKECVQAINNGDCIAIFPQGTRMPSIQPQPEQVEPGIALIASLTKAVMLPVTLVTKGNRVRMFRRTYVVIGEPIPAETYLNVPGLVKKKQLAEYLFAAVCNNYKVQNK